MLLDKTTLLYLFKNSISLTIFKKNQLHRIPFSILYENVTGEILTDEHIQKLKKKHHHNIENLTECRLQSSLQILEKFHITPYQACKDPHVFCINPITMDNYAEILKECGFVQIIPMHIIRYHTLVKSRTVKMLKKQGLITENTVIEDKLQQKFSNWPDDYHINKSDENVTSLLTIRMKVLELFLKWQLNVTSEEFHKYCKNYLPLKHKPMSDVQEAINLAINNIGFDHSVVRNNGFIISSDPVNTKLIIEKVPSIAGLDIREAIKLEPAILKSKYDSLLNVKNILEGYEIPNSAQEHCLRVYCMNPKTVKERLEELVNMKEYLALKSNPRVLKMVVHKKKMINRLNKMKEANKHVFSLNHFVSSSKVFNAYISSFGNKACSRDMALLICSSLKVTHINGTEVKFNDMSTKYKNEVISEVLNKLKRHKYYLHTALNVIYDNIKMLQRWFSNDVILNNCLILLYPMSEIQHYLEYFLNMRNSLNFYNDNKQLDSCYTSVCAQSLTDEHILSLVLYEIEKRHHFSGDGIWNKQDTKAESQLVI